MADRVNVISEVSVHNLTQVEWSVASSGTEWVGFTGDDDITPHLHVFLNDRLKDSIRQLVRAWDVADMVDMHNESCPACRGEDGECVTARQAVQS